MKSKNVQEKLRGSETIGALVTEDYRMAKIFKKYGIDFCCGGQVTLTTACRERGVDLETVEREIKETTNAPIERSDNFGSWGLAFLADYIVNNHHTYLNENTGDIAAYAHKIAEVHGARHPEVREIASLFERIAADMKDHLREEEEVLFPAIRRIETASKLGKTADAADREAIGSSLRKLHREHEAIGDAIHDIHRLANSYAIPEDVCNTYIVTYRKLKEFEDDLHKHVHLENNILFPKAQQL